MFTASIFLVLVVWVVVLWFAAEEFYNIASMKGYADRKYFWWCFLVSFIGYSMVIALPQKDCCGSDAIEDELPTL